MKAVRIIAIAFLLSTQAASAQTGPGWAWSTGKITNNGSITVKSASGAGTYNAVKNPMGAVAKTNQSAITQPPTVIVQATGASGPEELIPMIAAD